MTVILKCALAASVVLSATGIGTSIANNYRERPRQLRQLQFALQTMETEISYGATHMPEIWEKLSRRAEEPIAKIFENAVAYMQRTGATIANAFYDALHDTYRMTALLKSDVEILRALSGNLGQSGREGQIRCIRLAMAEIAVEQQKAEQERVANERMWRYLGFSTGITLVIVLL